MGFGDRYSPTLRKGWKSLEETLGAGTLLYVGNRGVGVGVGGNMGWRNYLYG